MNFKQETVSMTSFSFIALFVGVVCSSAIGQSLEGKLCTVSSTGASGTCKLFSLCPSVLKALRAGIFPTNCGFKVNEPIVCCTDGSIYSPDSLPARTPTISPAEVTSNPTTTNLPTNPSTTTQNDILLKKSKSEQKCKEYGEYVYQDAAIVPTIGDEPLPKVDDCQVVEIENIVGGTPAKLKEFPHMALIGFDDKNSVTHWDCGGSLISEKFVLTAAHCTLHGQYSDAKYVLLGVLVLDSIIYDKSPQKIAIKKIISHPEYLPPSYYHDIALMELEHAAILNSNVRPACLNTNSNLASRLSIATGWGRTSASGSASNALQKVTLDMFTNTECNYTYRRNIGLNIEHGIIEDTQLCAGSRNDSKDTCLGDSGGPLQIINRDVYCTYKIIGITSFGKACGHVGFPGVYTKVSAYVKWIEDIVWP